MVAVLFREVCVSLPVEEQKQKETRQRSTERTKHVGRDSTRHTLPPSSLWLAHPRLVTSHNSCTGYSASLEKKKKKEKKSFLAGGFSELLVTLCMPKACFVQSLGNSMALAHHLLPPSRGGLLGVSTKLVLWKGLWL